MKLYLRVVFFVFFSVSAYSQVGGEYVYNFLNLPTSARQVALGGATLTLTDDVNQPIWNPSVINNNLDRQLAVNYTSYLAGINIGSVSYAQTISRHFGTLHGNIKYLHYGAFIGADEKGNETSNFTASDIAVSVGYAVDLPILGFSVGANLKVITSTISTFSSVGIAVDFGLLYQHPQLPFELTVVARNLGIQIKSYNTIKEKLPFTVAFSGAYKLDHVPLKWYVTADNLQQWELAVSNPSNEIVDLEGNVTTENISFFKNMFRHFVVGVELFPERVINFRVGYNFRRAAELKLQSVRSFAGISFGFGLKMNKIKLNYAYSNVHTASNISTFSLQINLDR